MKTLRFFLTALLVSSFFGTAASAQSALTTEQATFVAQAIAAGVSPKKAMAAARRAAVNGTTPTVAEAEAISDAEADAEVTAADVEANAATIVTAAVNSGNSAAVTSVAAAITSTVVAEAADPVAAATAISNTVTTAAVQAAPAGSANDIATAVAQGTSSGAVSGAASNTVAVNVDASAVATAAVQASAGSATAAGATNTAEIVLESSVAATETAETETVEVEIEVVEIEVPVDEVVVINTASFHLVTVSLGGQRVNLVISDANNAAVAAVLSNVTVGTAVSSTSGSTDFDVFSIADINAVLTAANIEGGVNVADLQQAVINAINDATVQVLVNNNTLIVSPSS